MFKYFQEYRIVGAARDAFMTGVDLATGVHAKLPLKFLDLGQRAELGAGFTLNPTPAQRAVRRCCQQPGYLIAVVSPPVGKAPSGFRLPLRTSM